MRASHGRRPTAVALLLALGTACGAPRSAGDHSSPAAMHPLFAAQLPAAWPTPTEWATSTPETHGLDSDSLAAGIEYALAHDVNIHSLTIVRDGSIVLDVYFYPFIAGQRHDVASVTKSVTALLVGIAIADHKLAGTSQRIIPLLGDTAGVTIDPRAQRITIGDLLSMRSGFDCGFKHGEPELGEVTRSTAWVRTALSLPISSEPGTRWGYCSPNYHLLSAAVSKATGQSELAFGRSTLFAELGITNVDWPADPAGISRGWGDLQLIPRDMARLGLLMLAKGRWLDRHAIPSAWVDSVATFRALGNSHEDYGYGWWLSRETPGKIEAIGRGGQRITVLPSVNAVVVMTGGGFEPGDVGRFIGASLRSSSALPRNLEGERHMARAIAAASTPPPATPIALPAIAHEISGRAYHLDANALGVKTLELDFSDSARAVVTLVAGDKRIVLPVGLDGDYRLATDSSSGLLAAARGHWQSDGRFALDLNFLARINRYSITVAFSGETVTMDVNESTQLGHAVWQGSAAP